MKEDCYLRQAFIEEPTNKESGWVTVIKHLLKYYDMPNLISNISRP